MVKWLFWVWGALTGIVIGFMIAILLVDSGFMVVENPYEIPHNGFFYSRDFRTETYSRESIAERCAGNIVHCIDYDMAFEDSLLIDSNYFIPENYTFVRVAKGNLELSEDLSYWYFKPIKRPIGFAISGHCWTGKCIEQGGVFQAGRYSPRKGKK